MAEVESAIRRRPSGASHWWTGRMEVRTPAVREAEEGDEDEEEEEEEEELYGERGWDCARFCRAAVGFCWPGLSFLRGWPLAAAIVGAGERRARRGPPARQAAQLRSAPPGFAPLHLLTMCAALGSPPGCLLLLPLARPLWKRASGPLLLHAMPCHALAAAPLALCCCPPNIEPEAWMEASEAAAPSGA
ncbi:hypothetical protein Mp_3g21230 [Marchantia polymorpha subsp. ruderalis]|nr:hypothetical protein MARPO_0160s0018 [Marchantia polymorpha]BBN06446.1 hypothetical protein Mp_3g21230 [Marchantia polymorpha subsp. ruderalis]|eukprot:PTQ28566.1 hypothetical protein MARPO_0160s0018 [Marchantia polymorpha]